MNFTQILDSTRGHLHAGSCVQYHIARRNVYRRTHHKMVISCCRGEPLNSSFVLCSKIHMTIPTARKKAPVTIHIWGVNGRKKAQAPVFIFLNGATTTSPDATYGCVKSTIFVLLVVMAISPTAASNNCHSTWKHKPPNQINIVEKFFRSSGLISTHTRCDRIHQICVAWVFMTISKRNELIWNCIR